MQAGSAYSSKHLVPSFLFGRTYAPIVETSFQTLLWLSRLFTSSMNRHFLYFLFDKMSNFILDNHVL